jgi:hypothetical protein
MASMKCKSFVAGLALAAAAVGFDPSPGLAQPQPLIGNSRVAIDYVDPRVPRSQATLERLRKRQVLEELSQFLSPLRLPRILRVRTKSCGAANAFYVPTEWAINLCYEYYEYLEGLANRIDSTPGKFTRYDVIVGGFIDAVLHELGHALFDILEVPVFGREEDGADQAAAFVMLQFGKEVARTTIKGAAFTYLLSSNPRTRTAFADEHGTAGQRFFNYLCLGYGGEPEAFREFVDNGMLPKARAANCTREFRQVSRAFSKTILPHIDQAMMKQVRGRPWLRDTDAQ